MEPDKMRDNKWRHISGTMMPDRGDGIRRMIYVVTDITKQKQIETEIREKNSIIDVAMRNTDVNMWYFDYETAECQLTKSCQQAHEMPGVETLQNFPECLFEIGYVRGDCIETLRATYERLRTRGESIECDVWFKKADGSGWWCERDMLSPLIGEDGKATKGIGIGKNVTIEKILEEKFETFGAYRRLAEKNTRVSFRINLTTGWFGDCVSSTPEIIELYPTDSAEDFFNLLKNRIVGREDTQLFEQTISRQKLLEDFSNGETLRSVDCHFRKEDGSIIWLRITVEMMNNPMTADVEALLYSFDIDQEKNMQFLMKKLLEDDYEFLGLIDVTTERIMVFGKDSDTPDTARNGGLYEEEAKRVFSNLILEEYYEEGIRSMSLSLVENELQKKDYYTCSFPARDFANTKAGRKQWKFAYLDDSKSKILMTRTDITSIYTAEYDSLTGIYNKETFYSKARETLNQFPEQKFMIIRFDIDRFKAYNDIYGIRAGDHLLASIGKNFRENKWPEKVIFGRLQSDHFVLLVPEDTFDTELWSRKHEEWIKASAEGYRLTSSIGIYNISNREVEVSLMCDRALLALRTVKESYSKKLAWYNESLREKLMREQELAEDMEQALNEEQFVLYFQPQINYKDGSMIGAEALVRWMHPTQGLISPGEFIPLFEKNGFIQKLDAYVWEKSCEYLRKWLDSKLPCVPVSVNISRYNLYDPGLCEKFRDLINKYKLPYSMLNLEITESAYMDDPKQLVEIVNQLRDMGFIVEMDDFGSGYSSLNMLKDMPVDILKLDILFISESESNQRAATILSSIVHMAQALDLEVIAEGVETKEQADNLKSLNCFKMQGYHFKRPMPAEEFEKLFV